MWPIISIFISVLIMVIEVLLFTKITINKRNIISKWKLVFLIIITCIIHNIIYFSLSGITKTLIMFLVHITFCKITFNIPLSKSIFIIFLYTIMLMLIDFIQLFLATSILNVSKDYYYNEFSSSILSNITICIMFLILTLILRKPLKKVINAKINDSLKIIIFSVLTMISILLFFYAIVKEFRFNNDILLYLIAIIVLILVLFSLIKQTIENNNLTRKYDKLLEFMTTYETEIEKQRILRHEVKNEFLTVKAKICDKVKNEEVIKYIDDILEEKIKVKQEEYAKFGYLPPNGIKGLCYFKVQEAEEKGIHVSLSISKKVKKSIIYNFDIKQQRNFGKILGVILDNAIEASKDSEKKQMGIQAYVNAKKEFRMIISNTYNNKIDENKIGKESFSTKGKNRGHGLLLVKNIIETNKIFDIESEFNANIYSQTIIVKNLVIQSIDK